MCSYCKSVPTCQSPIPVRDSFAAARARGSGRGRLLLRLSSGNPATAEQSRAVWAQQDWVTPRTEQQHSALAAASWLGGQGHQAGISPRGMFHGTKCERTCTFLPFRVECDIFSPDSSLTTEGEVGKLCVPGPGPISSQPEGCLWFASHCHQVLRSGLQLPWVPLSPGI